MSHRPTETPTAKDNTENDANTNRNDGDKEPTTTKDQTTANTQQPVPINGEKGNQGLHDVTIHPPNSNSLDPASLGSGSGDPDHDPHRLSVSSAQHNDQFRRSSRLSFTLHKDQEPTQAQLGNKSHPTPAPVRHPARTFKPFTKESLAAIQARILAEAAQKQAQLEAEKEVKIALRGTTKAQTYLVLQGIVHHEHVVNPDPMLEAGLPLPRALQRQFPSELIATPIEDIDSYYQNKMVR